ncbi:MAG: DUF4382 domain-containing protein [Gemmatimonadaceae bacterium]
MSQNLGKVAGLIIAGFTAGAIACSESGVTSQGRGTLQIHLTDAPFPTDSVSRVDLYVVRVDAKLAESDSAEAARGTTDDSASTDGWTTIATPKAKVELLALRDGVSTMLGSTSVAAGSYRSFRIIIDPAQSSVTLKNGALLTSTSSPSIMFPSASRSGIKIQLDKAITVSEGSTTPVLVDFDVAQSFVLRGNSLAQQGLLFKPVIRGTLKTTTTTTTP